MCRLHGVDNLTHFVIQESHRDIAGRAVGTVAVVGGVERQQVQQNQIGAMIADHIRHRVGIQIVAPLLAARVREAIQLLLRQPSFADQLLCQWTLRVWRFGKLPIDRSRVVDRHPVRLRGL